MSAIFKCLYHNRAIYWHPGQGYGDELHVWASTMAEARAKIDAALASVKLSDADIYWSGLTSAERHRWRRDPRLWSEDLTAAELAYRERPQ